MHATIDKAPKERMNQLKQELKDTPKEIASAIIEENKLQFTLETEYILRDIAMYFGEVNVRNNASIYWGYHTDIKKDSIIEGGRNASATFYSLYNRLFE